MLFRSDRFMFNTFVDYPSDDELAEIVIRTTGGTAATVAAVMDADEILQIQQIVRRVPIARPVVDYIVRLSSVTRPGHASAPTIVKDYVGWGCGPRAAQYLALGAKAHAVLHGHTHAVRDEVIGPTRVMNPGALHRATRRTAMILDPATGAAEWLDIE